ncbi:DUF2690 domain-containing protein [Streptomyces sp. CB03238]|uniref:DUF2690 domain-containing protein n=1 Tax=Streptomyces sp. CB03238 TaxID=1907777 RepID=UPI000A115468|nr:DUF2690 domain-containing protein [Streptomyces sp. CB03238]ORT53973.1 hypothetical protein BKD26_36915 [Streptomyces sp. CB03238]
MITVIGAVVSAALPVVISKLMEDPPPSCPGAACDGKNPQKPGCSADALTWMPTKDNPVSLQVRYSMRCKALWARVLEGEGGDQLTIQVEGGSSQAAVIQFGTDQFTPMAAVVDRFRAKACAVPTTYDSRKGTWKKYCFHVTEKTAWSE